MGPETIRFISEDFERSNKRFRMRFPGKHFSRTRVLYLGGESLKSSCRRLVPFFRQSPGWTNRQKCQPGFVVDTFGDLSNLDIVEKKGTSCRQLLKSAHPGNAFRNIGSTFQNRRLGSMVLARHNDTPNQTSKSPIPDLSFMRQIGVSCPYAHL